MQTRTTLQAARIRRSAAQRAALHLKTLEPPLKSATAHKSHQSVRRRQRSAAASLPDRGTLRDILDDAPGEHDVVAGRFRLTDLEAYDEAAVVLGLGQIDAAVVVDRR